MKYFTREWASGALSDQEWEQKYTSYHQYIELLLPNLPDPIVQLIKQISLHDALVRRVVVDQKKGQLVLELGRGDLQVGYSDIDIIYSGVEFSTLDLSIYPEIMLSKT